MTKLLSFFKALPPVFQVLIILLAVGPAAAAATTLVIFLLNLAFQLAVITI